MTKNALNTMKEAIKWPMQSNAIIAPYLSKTVTNFGWAKVR